MDATLMPRSSYTFPTSETTTMSSPVQNAESSLTMAGQRGVEFANRILELYAESAWGLTDTFIKSILEISSALGSKTTLLEMRQLFLIEKLLDVGNQLERNSIAAGVIKFEPFSKPYAQLSTLSNKIEGTASHIRSSTAKTKWFTNVPGDLNEMLGELLQLYFGPSNKKLDFEPPSEYSFQTTWDLLERAGEKLASPFPYGAIVVEDGEVSIEWRIQDRAVLLTIPALETGSHSIYHGDEKEYDLERDVTAENMAHWLNWIVEAPEL